jgi:multidrug efflux system outer membrane protein
MCNKRGLMARSVVVQAIIRCAAGVVPLLSVGCLFRPEYERPVVLEEKSFRDGAASEDTIANMKWWEIFEDPYLEKLIGTALENNRDLKVAMARIDEARGVLGFTRPDQFPRIDVSGRALRTDASDLSAFPTGLNNDFDLLGRLNFEIDIWGRYASATEAARSQLLSTEYAYRAVTLALVAQVAQTYLRLLDVDREILIAQRTVENRHSATKIIEERFKGGHTAKIDLNQAQIQEQDAIAARIVFEREQRLLENSLSVLKGDAPHAIERAAPTTNPLTLSIERIPAGVPAMVLARRPDVRAAEESARAAVMRVGVARAQQYPALTVTGFIGLNSADSGDLFKGDARTWSIGGLALGPLFDFFKSWSRVDAAEAQADQALETYEQSVLLAVKDVEDAMVAVRTYHEEQSVRRAQVEAARSANFLSRQRYDNGISSFLEVLNTETSLFEAELQYSFTQQRYLAAIVQLYKSLGGGWELPEKAEEQVGALSQK